MQPEEPSRIDELLRAYSREKRKAADFELHPATRELLQGEVRRQCRDRGRDPSFSWRSVLPRFALGSVIFTVLVASLVLIFYQRQTRIMQLSAARPPAATPALPGSFGEEGVAGQSMAEEKLKKESDVYLFKEQAKPARDAAPVDLLNTPTSASAAQKGLADKESDRLARSALPAAASEAQNSNKKAPAPTRDLAESRNAQLEPLKSARLPEISMKIIPREEAKRKDETLTREAESVRPGAIFPDRSSLASSLDAATQEWAFHKIDNYNNRFRRNVQSPPPSSVLDSFVLRRLGRTVQVIDGDGSVYQSENVSRKLALLAETSAGQTANSSNQFGFQVAGTNNRLGKLVFFSGWVGLPTNLPIVSLRAYSATPTADAPSPQPQPLSVGGTVRVGTNEEFRLQALEKKP